MRGEPVLLPADREAASSSPGKAMGLQMLSGGLILTVTTDRDRTEVASAMALHECRQITELIIVYLICTNKIKTIVL